MSKRGRKLIFKDGYKMVRVDALTHHLLGEQADSHGLGLGPYVRALSRLLFDKTDLLTGESAIFKNEAWMQEKGLVNVREEQPGIFWQAAIASAVESNPDITRVGWYSKRKDGTWYFDYDRFGKWEKERKRTEGIRPDIQEVLREIVKES